MIYQLPQPKQSYLALHIDEFPAQAFVAYNPGWGALPFVVMQQVAGRHKSKVLAVSPEAEGRDICPGMLVSEMSVTQKKGLQFVTRKPEYEHLVIEDLGVIACRYTPDYEVDLAGGCVLNMSGTPLLRENSIEGAVAHLRLLVENTIGLKRIGFGLSGMKTLSKILARSSTSGLLTCPIGHEDLWLRRAEVQDLPDLPDWCFRKMALLGIRRIEQIFPMSKREMMKRFGHEFGEWLYMLSIGQDLCYRPLEKACFQNEKVLFEDVNDDGLLREHLLETADKVFHRIQQYGRFAKAMRVVIRYSDGKKAEASITLAPPANRLEQAGVALYSCFCQLYQRRVAIRAISVSCRHFVRQGAGRQLSLFDVDDLRTQDRTAAINDLRERFGFSALSKGVYHRVSDGAS